MDDNRDPKPSPDPLTDVLRRALNRPPKTIPRLKRAPYRKGQIEAPGMALR